MLDLGYVQLGQSSTLSGGEAQRIKLASFLVKGNTKKSIICFGGITTGLHFHDIKKIATSFDALVILHSILVVGNLYNKMYRLDY
jgi:excinuclease ABC subunit A